MTVAAEPTRQVQTLYIQKETLIAAPADVVFETLLTPIGRMAEMNVKIEPWPGGRWYRDLGDSNGHFWATVQAIKRPTLLELTGPLFMSAPVLNNLQYRLSEKDGGTLITFRHTALGFVSDEHKAGMTQGWAHIFERVRQQSETIRSGRGAGK